VVTKALRARPIRSVLEGVFRMRFLPFRSFLACSLALVLGLPGSALAAAPGKSKSSKPGKGEASETEKDPGDPSVPPAEHAGSPRVGRVFVDAGGLGDAGPVIGGRATLAGKGALQGQGVTHTDAPAGPELQVTLKERDAGGYRVDYVIVYDGKPVKNGAGGFDCQLCTEDELVEKVEALVIQVAPKMVVPEPETDGGSDTEPDVEDPDDDGGSGSHDGNGGGGGTVEDGDPNGLRGMGKAGIALMVVGGLGVIGGVPLLVIQPLPVENDPLQATKARNTKPMGGAMLGVGAAVLVTGVVLLALDRKLAKARRTKAAAMVHPWLRADGGGVGVVGRF
jgi:hypothetical protein